MVIIARLVRMTRMMMAMLVRMTRMAGDDSYDGKNDENCMLMIDMSVR